MDLDFSKYAKEVDDYSILRDELIKKSRDLLKASKHLIFAIHRKDMNSAKKQHKELFDLRDAFVNIAGKHPDLSFEGSYSEAMQEFVEAIALYSLVVDKKIVEKPEYVTVTDFLCGLCDLTGEISRFVVNHAIERKIDDVRFYKEVVEKLYGELLKFNMRNGSLRQKYDSVKYNLKNIEKVLYELSLKDVV